MRGVTRVTRCFINNYSFQLTRLMRGVTIAPYTAVSPDSEFQLTRLMRGVTCYSYY